MFEFYYSFIYQDFSFFNFDKPDNENISYKDSKILKDYIAPNIPTPYYFLYLIKKKIISEKYKSFNFIDLGCGSGRLVKYFDKNFDINFIGIDISQNVIETNKSKFKKDNFKFFLMDLKKIKEISDLELLDPKILDKDLNIVFISDSVDAQTIYNFLPIFKQKLGNFFFIMVNQKDLDVFSGLDSIGNIFFKNKTRNINFFKI